MSDLLIENAVDSRSFKFPIEGKKVITIGKLPENDIVLEQNGVSRKHCEFSFVGGQWRILDLGSKNGTLLDDKKVTAETPIQSGQKIKIADYIISIVEDIPPQSRPAVDTQSRDTVSVSSNRANVTPPELKKEIHTLLIEKMDLKHTDVSSKSQEELYNHTFQVCMGIISSLKFKVPGWLKPEALAKEVVDEAVVLGPLEELLSDEKVTEIMVIGWDKIYVERSGKIELSPLQFTDDSQVIAVIRRILAPIGRRIDETSPMADGRLQDGSRVNAIIPPLALSGPTLTIRKFSSTPFVASDLVRFESLTDNMVRFLELAVNNRKNILISGGTGSGKTTLLNVISGFIPGGERIVTVEDAAELQLPQEHVVRLESRPPNIEGKNAVLIRDLVKNSLRMRPDRIVVGECRGGEALDMLQAMNTGHDGSLTTLHANTPRDAISRLETLVLMAGMELPSRAIREQISSAVDLIVQIARLSDGGRRVTNVTAVTGMEGDVVCLQDIYSFTQEGFDSEGKIRGFHKATGMIPDFVHDLKDRGIGVDLSIFS
ncbi:MAG: ATPase, T2SS/T4P/T4SS family [Planctomycetota bacterium]|jgi:pilus assembly protein CpaF